MTRHAPLIFKSRQETVELAEGTLEAMIYSHTCYNGEQSPCG